MSHKGLIISTTYIDLDIASLKENQELSIAVFDKDADEEVLINLTSSQAVRLAAILDAWAEKGYLPEGEEVWE